MFHRITQKWLTFLLAVVMIIGMVPFHASAASTNYTDFMADLKQLEIYADEYAKAVNRDSGELVLNFIRTGVERYQDSNWTTLAGQEIVGFTNYVKTQDTEKGTTVMDLRDIVIDNFTLPNGNKVDFGHMFGCMNISLVAAGSADLSGWAGDICDLLQYSVKNLDDINANTNGTVEEMAAYVGKNCFGVDADGAFGWDDFYGDMDAYYLITEYKKGGKLFSELMDDYFATGLNDVDRTVYFMNNRFAVEDSQAAVRKAIYESYSSDVGIKVLESGRGLSSYNALREACCYAFADYVYSQAKGKLVAGSGDDETAANGYYSVFSNEHSILAPGVEQDINYAQTVDGKQIVYYVAKVDVTREDVDLLVNYKDNKAPKGSNIGLQKVEDQTAALLKNYRAKKDENGNPLYENFNAIVATNGAGYNITNGIPSGLVVMEGVEYSAVGNPGFFAILKDGSAMIGTKEDYATHKNEIKEGIQAFGSVLVKDGKVAVTKSANYTSNRASRTAIGITAKGEVVMMVLDGRQLPRSAGGAMEEIAQIMLEAGCVDAVNLDGGGSTTYLSKPAGSNEIQLMNVPSDGYARSVSTSLVAVSTAAASTAFDHAVISSDHEYITAGTSMQFSVTGVSNTGNAADIPAGSYWKVSDEAVASIDENGLFTAKSNGEVTVQYIVNDKVAGEKLIKVVVPDDIKFAEERMTAIYGVPKKIDVTCWYKGYPVAFTPLRDAFVFFNYEFDQYGIPTLYFNSDAGVINGLEFIGSDAKGIRTATVYAALLNGNSILDTAGANINLYKADEATFDFENATQGNRQLAWYREIENAKTTDNQLYRVSDPESPVEIDYTFALDMTSIDIPAQLEPLKSMLPTYQENATAWTYLLQLAERVCVQTNVTITAEFSKDLAIDISNLKVVNDYFELTNYSLDENNVLTLICNWKNQSQPIAEATANPLCILSGIKATVKDTAAYYNNEVTIANNGNVSYDIYLAASSLYSFAQDANNQAEFSLYPYIHEEDCRSDFSDESDDEAAAENNDKGAHFSSQYTDFADIFVVNTEIRQGWHEEDGDYYYYVNNEAVTGTQLVPDRKDATQKRFYEFDKTGKLVSEQGATGLITHEGDLYYAVLGAAQTGWQRVGTNDYYFHPDTGKAVDGEYTIREKMNPAVADGKYTPMVDYTYTFKDHVLTLGAWVYDENVIGNDSKYHTGWHYRWAGDWVEGWFEVLGEYYFAKKDYPRMINTGYVRVMKQDAADSTDTQYHLFDERGVLQKDYSGHYFDGKNYVFLKNGVRQIIEGVYDGNGYYYYVLGDGTIVINAAKYVVKTETVDRTNGLVPGAKTYNFDEYGRMTKAFVTVNENIKDDIKVEMGYSESVMGRAVTITNDVACKVGYRDKASDKYVELKAINNGDGTYNFAVPAGVDEVELVLAGDVTADGEATVSDLAKLNACLLRKTLNGQTAELTDAKGILAADVNGDGRVTVSDLSRLQAILLDKTKGW